MAGHCGAFVFACWLRQVAYQVQCTYRTLLSHLLPALTLDGTTKLPIHFGVFARDSQVSFYEALVVQSAKDTGSVSGCIACTDE